MKGSRFGRSASALRRVDTGAQPERDTMDQADVLRRLAVALGDPSGSQSLEQLLQTLLSISGMDLALLGEVSSPDRGKVRTIATWFDSAPVPEFEYEVAGTPCANVLVGGTCVYPVNVQALFPSDQALVDLGVESYAGMPLISSSGEPLGIVVLLGRKPLRDPDDVERLLRMVALRLAGEIQQRRYLQSLKRLHSENRMLATAIEQVGEPVLIANLEGRISYVNEAFERVTGFARREVLGRSPGILKSGAQGADFYDNLWRTLAAGHSFSGVFVNRRKSGDTYFADQIITPLRDESGRTTHYIAVGRDITERVRSDERLNFLARHDPLTGLPNRASFSMALSLALLHEEPFRAPVAMFAVDIDHFREINEASGQMVGDAALRAVAARLRTVLRAGDMIARLGGDEFASFVPGIATEEGAGRIAEKIVRAFDAPLVLNGRHVYVSVSVGVSLYPVDARDSERLQHNAEVAMRRAKARTERAGAWRCFDAAMGAAVDRRLVLKEALRGALDRGEFYLDYQPQVLLRDGSLVGAEALLRWRHPELGMVSPAEFVPVAEESDFILGIGHWVLREAMRQAAGFRAAGRPLRVAINVSGRQFGCPDFADVVQGLMTETGCRPDDIEIEITETVAMRNAEAALQQMERLVRLGVEIAVDDFGTGYSSLGYLRRFPIRTLKIDRSFVCDAATSGHAAGLVRTMIAMARVLGLRVLAEGVEDEAQRQFLLSEGCELAQGYLFARPGPPEQLISGS